MLWARQLGCQDRFHNRSSSYCNPASYRHLHGIVFKRSDSLIISQAIFSASMFNEYDVVESTRQLGDSVPMGSVGTVLIVHTKPSVAYEVEFMRHGETLDVLTVLDEDIVPCHRPDAL